MPEPIIELRGNRRVVLKPLDDDCLLDGELHPSIALRLTRIRELPMTAIANFHGVERIDGRAVLVWDFVEGTTLADIEPERRAAVRGELELIVSTLHSHGIVHGGLHERNVIIDDRGGVHLTHLSPLLHNDPDEDVVAIKRILHVRSSKFEVERLTFIARESELRTSNVELRTSNEQANSRAIVGALVALVIGIAIAASFIWYSSHAL